MATELTETHPGILEKALNMLGNGMTQTAIARHFGISRDRLRTLFRKNQISVATYRSDKISEDEIHSAINLYLSGQTWEDVEKNTGHTQELIKNLAIKLGYSLPFVAKMRRLHRWDGREFGSWRVLPGTSGIYGARTVMTECVCGKRVVNLKSNLLSHASTSCGCVGLKKDTRGYQSDHIKWTCLETGEEVSTTCALGKLLNIKNPTLYRHASRMENYEDWLGYTWMPTPYKQKATSNNAGLVHKLEYIKELIADGKSIPQIARILNINYQMLYKFAKRQQLQFNNSRDARTRSKQSNYKQTVM